MDYEWLLFDKIGHKEDWSLVRVVFRWGFHFSTGKSLIKDHPEKRIWLLLHENGIYRERESIDLLFMVMYCC